MKKSITLACWGAAAILLLYAPGLQAQEAILNGDFETASITPPWTLTGGNTNTTIATFQTVSSVNSLCLKRMPGSPNNNGSFEQQVHLIKDVMYLFRADIAAVESG